MELEKLGEIMNRFKFIFPIFYLSFFISIFSLEAKPKIYDCFMFFNELELLEIRLHELYDQVDKFVLVESAQTHQGNRKPFYFLENRHRFEKFQDKIIHVMVHDFLVTDDSWEIEGYQRDQIMRGLKDCKDDDIIIVSDLDEIIRADIIPKIVQGLRRIPFIECQLKIYWYFLNRLGAVEEWWFGPVATCFKNLKDKTPNDLRRMRGAVPVIRKAGWHFTWLGGFERVVMKGEAYAHAEHNNANLRDPEHIKNNVKFHKLVEIDETFPKYVRENEDYFREIGFIDNGEAEVLRER